MCGCMAAKVKVHECGLRLLWHRLNAGPVCDDSSAEGSTCANVVLFKWTFLTFYPYYMTSKYCPYSRGLEKLLRRDAMTALPSKYSSKCHMAAMGRPKTTWKRRSGGDVDSKIQVQLEEDQGGSREQSWRWRRVVCGMCATRSDEA